MIDKKIAGIISFCLATLVALLPFNIIVGAKFAWFSFSSMVIPALGYHCSLLYVILYIFTKGLLLSSFSFLFFVRRVPLFFATIALRSRDVKVHVLLPILAMVIFCAHPIGFHAFYYSLYWFIPVAVYYWNIDSMYMRSISASFIAHAVGSVLFLYAGSLPASTWTALVPLVFVERLLIAGGMICGMHIFKNIEDFCTIKAIA